jgi:hypothetical protein
VAVRDDSGRHRRGELRPRGVGVAPGDLDDRAGRLRERGWRLVFRAVAGGLREGVPEELRDVDVRVVDRDAGHASETRETPDLVPGDEVVLDHLGLALALGAETAHNDVPVRGRAPSQRGYVLM